jgi:hypothetical protein
LEKLAGFKLQILSLHQWAGVEISTYLLKWGEPLEGNTIGADLTQSGNFSQRLDSSPVCFWLLPMLSNKSYLQKI